MSLSLCICLCSGHEVASPKVLYLTEKATVGDLYIALTMNIFYLITRDTTFVFTQSRGAYILLDMS